MRIPRDTLHALLDQWAADRPARRLEADRVQRQIEEQQAREQRRADIRAIRTPSRTLDAYEMEQDRLKQASHGAHE